MSTGSPSQGTNDAGELKITETGDAAMATAPMLLRLQQLGNKLGWIAWFFPVAAAACILFQSIRTADNRPYWMDELLTVTSVSDPSCGHMLHALGDQVDGSFPLYTVVAWGWAQLFGARELPLRSLSGGLFAVAAIVFWIALRRVCGRPVAALALAAVFFHSADMTVQFSEARAYGFVCLSAALCCLSLLKTPQDVSFRNRAFWGLSASSAMLTLSHPLGIPYVIGLGLLTLVYDWWITRRLTGRPAAIGLGLCAILVWLPQMLGQMGLNKPHGWIIQPTFHDLVWTYATFFNVLPQYFWVYLFFLTIIAGLVAKRLGHLPAERAVLIRMACVIALALLSVPGLAWIFSQFFSVIFLDRYFLPSRLGAAFVIAIILELALDRFSLVNKLLYKAVLWGLAILVTSSFVAAAAAHDTRFEQSREPPPEYADWPVAWDRPFDYMPKTFYGSHAERYYFVLDQDSARLRQYSLNAMQDYWLMTARKRNYPNLKDCRNILPLDEFLADRDRFVVSRTRTGNPWFDLRIKNNPKYSWKIVYSDVHCVLYAVVRKP